MFKTIITISLAIVIASIGCSSNSGKGSASSGDKGAVGSGNANTPSGGGSGPSIGGGNSGCAEDSALNCAHSIGVTCWGNVFPDPSQYNCSYGVCETNDCQTYDSNDFEGYCCN
jgi:hypothetical protein